VIAKSDFARFYLRGVCARAVAAGVERVEIYRTHSPRNPTRESEAFIGRQLDARRLLADLRSLGSLDRALGLPPGASTGLWVRLVISERTA